MNLKGYERKWSLPNKRYYLGICLKTMRKTTKNLSQDSQYSSRDSDPGPPGYEAEVLTTPPRHPVTLYKY
jgi:hypothetical protein